jgi:transposase
MSWRRGQPYSQDLRDRVLAAVDEGMSVRAAAVRFGVSPAYVAKATARRRRTGERNARPQRSHQAQKLVAYHEAIRSRVLACPDATINELRQWLAAEYAVTSSTGGMWNTLSRLRLTLKKSRSGRASKTGRTSRRPAPSGAISSPI